MSLNNFVFLLNSLGVLSIIDRLLKWYARRRDAEWREAVLYGYRHFEGKELQDFLRIVDEVDEGSVLNEGQKKVEKKS